VAARNNENVVDDEGPKEEAKNKQIPNEKPIKKDKINSLH
jgi:hypothetical protein